MLNTTKTKLAETANEAFYSVQNFQFDEKAINKSINPTISKNLSRSALDQAGIDARVFEQDKNRTNLFYNHRNGLDNVSASQNFNKIHYLIMI